MAKKIKDMKITEAQLKAIKEITDDYSAMIGCAHDEKIDKLWIRRIKLVDRFLKKNGLKRDYN